MFDNDASVTGQITGLVADFANLTKYDAETEFELAFTLVEPESEPKSFLHFFFPRVKIGDVSKQLQGDGALIHTMPLIIGPKVAASGYDPTVCSILTG